MTNHRPSGLNSTAATAGVSLAATGNVGGILASCNSPAVRKELESGPPTYVRSCRPVSASQRIAVPSLEAVNSCAAPGRNATAVTPAVWPVCGTSSTRAGGWAVAASKPKSRTGNQTDARIGRSWHPPSNWNLLAIVGLTNNILAPCRHTSCPAPATSRRAGGC